MVFGTRTSQSEGVCTVNKKVGRQAARKGRSEMDMGMDEEADNEGGGRQKRKE